MSDRAEPVNLVEGILNQCTRCRELLTEYKAIGPAGAFGHAAISADIREGEAALASGDVIRMMRAYKVLEGCQ